MSEGPLRFERRAAQRFELHLPLTVRVVGSAREEPGFAQDLTARGIFFYTDLRLEPGTQVEVTLVMPAEITLSENMRVRCRGEVVRISPPSTYAVPGKTGASSGCKVGVAVHLQHYEYLTDTPATALTAAHGRAGALHDHPLEDEAATQDLSRAAYRNAATS